jgi:hypothetical protein
MDSATIGTTSEQFLGQWKQLISTTNWEKGRIIHEWRSALIAADMNSADYSDEAWSRQVGSVTPQHVGRLRRVYERFGEVHASYGGLFWSHFQAALDWNDAEMWLEGAVQSRWPVAEMRRTRWEALGAPAALKPREQDIVSAELDEDSEQQGAEVDSLAGSIDVVRSAHKAGGAEAAEDSDASWSDAVDGSDQDYETDSATACDEAEPIRPFANLATLPADVSEAFESFKLSILKHKLAGWAEIAREDLLAALDSLKELALAPARL